MIQKSNRAEILEAAYWLFYEQGYQQTSLEDIAKRCNVTKQAVSYHFGSKGGLGKEVSALLSIRLKQSFLALVAEHIPDCPKIELDAAYLIWFSRLYQHDRKAFRFFQEFILLDENFLELVDFVQLACNGDIPNAEEITPEEVRQLQIISAFYAGKGLLYQYALGKLCCDDELFEQFFLANYFQSSFSRQEIDKLYQQGKQLLRSIGPEKLPYRMDLFM